MRDSVSARSTEPSSLAEAKPSEHNDVIQVQARPRPPSGHETTETQRASERETERAEKENEKRLPRLNTPVEKSLIKREIGSLYTP